MTLQLFSPEKPAMPSLATALKNLQNKEVTIWVNHPDLKMMGGVVSRAETDHFELLSGDVRFFISYSALVAVSPT